MRHQHWRYHLEEIKPVEAYLSDLLVLDSQSLMTRYVLQCVTVCCSVLQCVAVCCLAYLSDLLVLDSQSLMTRYVLQCVTVCCSVLQCVAVWYSVLQCVAWRTCPISLSSIPKSS